MQSEAGHAAPRMASARFPGEPGTSPLESKEAAPRALVEPLDSAVVGATGFFVGTDTSWHGNWLQQLVGEGGDRELAEVREPPAWGIENRSPAKLWSSNKIDVNSASVTLLATLPWLGPAKARAIISERDRRGGFRSLKELSQVAGISKHDLDRFERFLKVE